MYDNETPSLLKLETPVNRIRRPKSIHKSSKYYNRLTYPSNEVFCGDSETDSSPIRLAESFKQGISWTTFLDGIKWLKSAELVNQSYTCMLRMCKQRGTRVADYWSE